MSNKSHFISGGIGIALGAVITAMLIPLRCYQTTSTEEQAKSTTETVETKVIVETEPVAVESKVTLPEDKPIAETSIEKDNSIKINGFYALRATADSTSRIKLHFTTKENVNVKLNELLFVTPKVDNLEVSHSWWENCMILSGDFKPETTYTLTLKAGMRSNENEHLLQDATLTVTTPEMQPNLEFMTWRGQMALTPETSIAYAYTACKEINVKAWKAFNNNLIGYGQSTWNDHLLEPCGEMTLTVPYDKTTERHALLPLYELVKGKPGVYRFMISTQGSSDECYIILSNIGASYVYDHRLAPMVALQNLVTGMPIANARVDVYDNKHQLVATGISDAQGFATTTLTPEVSTRTSKPRLLRMIITAGDDVTIIECNPSTQHDAYLPDTKTIAPFPTYVWPDRDAIHPGEVVQLYGLIRTATLTAAPAMPVALELYSPEQTLLTKADVTSNEDGYFTTSFTLPKGAKTGYYTVYAKLDGEILNQTELYVADFTPNHVKLDLTFVDASIEALDLTTMTYFGSPVTQGRGFYRLTANYAPTPDAWKGWTVGTQEGSRELHSDSFIKDSKEATLRLKGVDADVLKTFDAPVRINAMASFSEPNARAVTTTISIDQSYYPAYLGMRYDEDAQMLELKQLVTEGHLATTSTVKEFLLTEHISTYELVKKNNGWRYAWVESTQEVPTTSILPTGQSIPLGTDIVRLPLTNLKPGRYTLSAMLGDVTTSVTFWHNTAELGKRLGNPSNLVFKTDKPSYKAGETAIISFEAPTAGRLILASGDTTVQERFVMNVQAGIVNVPITIPTTTTHGVWHVGFTLIANDVMHEGRSFGLAPLTINHNDKALTLTLDLPKVVKPEVTIPITLKLTDSQGQPCRGTVALFAVDEAILDVTAFETPDPHTAIFQREGQTFTFGDIYSTLLPQLKLGPDGRIGGDKMLAKPLTNDDIADISKETTVITLPLQTIDATGTLTVPVTLPTFAGTLRFMAVVANETKVGATEATIIVRPPVTLTASGVRYGCAGDRAECTLRVINHDLPQQAYTLTMAGETFTGELATGETAYHTLTLPVGETTATLKMGELTTTITHSVALQEEVPAHTVVTIHHLKEGETLPEGAEVLPSLAAARQVALDWLANYPYTCTEQLAARMLPYTTSKQANERAFVKTLFNTLMPRLSSTGYFTLWDNGTLVHTMASLSASHVLIESSKSGILPVEHLPKLLTFLNLVANNTEEKLRGEAAYAAFLLGEAGAKPQALRAARHLLVVANDDAAAFIAAATLVFNGAADEGAPVMKAYLAKNPRPEPLVKNYMDEATAQAMTLAFALRAGVCSDAEVESRLATLLTTPWTTTQANAWAARALAACDRLPQGILYRQLVPSKAIPTDAPIHVTKRLLNIDAEPVTTLSHGDLAFVVITMNLPTDCNNIVVRDRLPGGLEYEDPNLATRESIELPDALKLATRFYPQSEENLGSELRFFGGASKGVTHVIYPVRATTKGTFAIPAALVEDMYNVDCVGGEDPKEMLTIQ